MRLDRPACYRALVARDSRFDGIFFVGVTSTGIYCRPVCTARTPRAANCRFFGSAAAAERMGFRPCLRCRPELAPGTSAVDAADVLAAKATQRIAAGALNTGSVDTLAGELGVTARHLRRVVVQEVGVSPVELATTHRLLLAKRLLHETTLPVGQIAFASGFESLRRFNAAFRARYRLAPQSLRREVRALGTPAPANDALTLALEYRPPIDWAGLLAFLGPRATPGVEQVDGDRYTRAVRIEGVTGHVSIAPDDGEASSSRRRVHPRRGVLRATISPSLVPMLMPLLARLRDLFDLDANPDVINRHFARTGLPGAARAVPGIRIPGGVDGFELAVRAVLGQQVSVKGATTLMRRFVEAFGEPYADGPDGITRLTPEAATVARVRPADIAELGMPLARAEALLAVARGAADGTLQLEPGGDVAATIRGLTTIRGIGDWTAQYIAMRALRWPDAFPAGDLVLRKAAGDLTPRQLTLHAEPWRPWRAYAALLLWRSHGATTSLPSDTNDE